MKVICPKCQKPGTLKVRTIKGKKYVIIDHRNTQHGLGPIEDKDKIINELVTAFKECISNILTKHLK